MLRGNQNNFYCQWQWWLNVVLVAIEFGVTKWCKFWSPSTLLQKAWYGFWPRLIQCDVGQRQQLNTHMQPYHAHVKWKLNIHKKWDPKNLYWKKLLIWFNKLSRCKLWWLIFVIKRCFFHGHPLFKCIWWLIYPKIY